MAGWASTSSHGITVALDLTLTPALIAEGQARESVNRLQHLRKTLGFAVEDKVDAGLFTSDKALLDALTTHSDYLKGEVQIKALTWLTKAPTQAHTIEIGEAELHVQLSK